jgi:hypothetical protein
MDVELGGGGAEGIETGFDSAYNRGGKKAGTYTKAGGTWNYAPPDKELAAGYFGFKTVFRVRGKKAALTAKKAIKILAMEVVIIPTVFFALAGLLLEKKFKFDYRHLRLVFRLAKGLVRGDTKNAMKKQKNNAVKKHHPTENRRGKTKNAP